MRILLQCVGGNGNLLLNVGPDANGRIEPRQVARLAEIGAWLEANGESVYGTRGGPILPSPQLVSTRKGRSIYLHVFAGAPESILLPALPCVVESARVLGGEVVGFEADRSGWRLHLPKEARREHVTVLELRIDRSPLQLGTVRMPSRFRSVRASNVFRGRPEYGPEMAFDGDPGTRWATDAGTRSAWIEVELREAAVVRGLKVVEPERYRRVRAYRVMGRVDGRWRELVRGEAIEEGAARFAEVRLSAIRLELLDASEGPTLAEIEIVPGKAP